MDKRKMLASILSVLTIVTSIGCWYSIQRAVMVSGSSIWIVPIVLFSVYLILICLDIILIQEYLLLELMLAFSLLLSFVFSPHLYQLGAIVIAAYFLFVAIRFIKRELLLNIKINIWRALQSGKSFLIISMVIMIATQYFLLTTQLGGQVGVPQLDLTPIVKKIALPVIATFNPALKDVNNETLTVDQFFLITEQENLKNNAQSLDDQILDTQLPQNVTPAQKDMIRQQLQDDITKSQSELSQKTNDLMLKSFHSQLSNIAGYQIIGSEKISDVYAAMVSGKLNNFLRYPVKVGGKETSAYPIVLTLILILTIYPIGTLLSLIWFFVIKLIFFILVKAKIVKINKITVQKEIIA